METGLETGSEIPRLSIDEPHFEEDWTLREARPVVPLEAIESSRHRRLVLRLTSAFIVAVLLGALTALVSVRWKQAAPPSTEEVVAIADDKPDDMKLSENEMVDVPQDQPAVAEHETSKSAALSQSKAFVRPVKSLHEVKTEPKPEPEPEPEVVTTPQPQPTLRELWEERRLRRVMRRERRERNAQRNRDLFRIDELFEGQRPH